MAWIERQKDVIDFEFHFTIIRNNLSGVLKKKTNYIVCIDTDTFKLKLLVSTS